MRDEDDGQPVTRAMIYLHLGRVETAERMLATLPPETLTRWATTADALSQACLAVARQVATLPTVPPEELAAAQREHERIHPEVYGKPPAGAGPQPARLTFLDDFGFEDDDESEDPS